MDSPYEAERESRDCLLKRLETWNIFAERVLSTVIKEVNVWFWIFPHTFQNITCSLMSAVFWWNVKEKPTDWNGVVRFPGWSESVSVCGSCTLAVLVGCGLSSVLFVFLQFLFFFSPLISLISLTVASLQVVAQDFMLSCYHCLTLSSSLLLFCLADVSCSLHSSAASSSSSCLSVVVLPCCCFFVFRGGPLSSSSVCWRAFF